MDLKKLNSIKSLENQPAERKTHQHPDNSRRADRANVKTPVEPADEPKKDKDDGYSNVRISRDVSNRLGALKEVTGYSSRSVLLEEMLKIVDPVLLNSGNKKRKFRHDLLVLKKKHQILKALQNQL